MTTPKSTINRRVVLGGMAASPLLVHSSSVFAQQPAGTPIRVGGTLPLTGALGSVGVLRKIAGEVFIDDINKRGGLLGRPLQFVLLDDQSQAANTRTLYERLVTADKVDLLMGPYATSSILAAMGVAQRYNKLFIQSSLGDPALGKYELHFPALPLGPNRRITDAEVVFDAYAGTPTPPKTVAIVTSKFPSALDIASGAKEVAEKRGLAVKMFLEYEFGVKDWGPIAARVKDADADLFYMGTLGLESVQFLEAAKKLEYVPPRHFYLFPAPGPLAANASADGATSLTWFEEHAPYSTNAGAAQFIAQFRDRAKAAGLPFPFAEYQAASEYAAWQMLEAAAVGTKGLDDKAMGAWLTKATVATVLGRQTFDGPNNGGPSATALKQVQNGKWAAVWPIKYREPGGKFNAK